MEGRRMSKCKEPLYQLLPDSIKYDDQVKSITTAIQDQLDEICQSTSLIELFSNIDSLPEPILRLLAWENGLNGPEWVLAKTIENKRDIIKNSFILNKRRGTVWAVKRIFDLTGYRAEISEWFEHGGEPFTFKITVLDVGTGGIATKDLDIMAEMLAIYKPVTRHLAGTNIELNTHTGYGKAVSFITMSAVLTVNPARVGDIDVNSIKKSKSGITLTGLLEVK